MAEYILNIQKRIEADSEIEAEIQASQYIGEILSGRFCRRLAEASTAIEAGTSQDVDVIGIYYVMDEYLETFEKLNVGRNIVVQNAGFAARSMGYDYEVKVKTRK